MKIPVDIFVGEDGGLCRGDLNFWAGVPEKKGEKREQGWEEKIGWGSGG